MSIKEKIKEGADDESDKAWKWAFDHLEEQNASNAYEYGVRAGFTLGAEYGYRLAVEELRNHSGLKESPFGEDWAKWLERRIEE